MTKPRLRCRLRYGDDIERARALALQALRSQPDILSEPAPDVLTVGLADSSVAMRARWWIKPPRHSEAVDARDKVIAEMKKRLLAAGIDIPFPTSHVLFHDQTEDTDGDRSRQREGWPAGNRDVPASRSIASAVRRLDDRNEQNDPDAEPSARR